MFEYPGYYQHFYSMQLYIGLKRLVAPMFPDKAAEERTKAPADARCPSSKEQFEQQQQRQRQRRLKTT